MMYEFYLLPSSTPWPTKHVSLMQPVLSGSRLAYLYENMQLKFESLEENQK